MRARGCYVFSAIAQQILLTDCASGLEGAIKRSINCHMIRWSKMLRCCYTGKHTSCCTTRVADHVYQTEDSAIPFPPSDRLTVCNISYVLDVHNSCSCHTFLESAERHGQAAITRNAGVAAYCADCAAMLSSRVTPSVPPVPVCRGHLTHLSVRKRLPASLRPLRPRRCNYSVISQATTSIQTALPSGSPDPQHVRSPISSVCAHAWLRSRASLCLRTPSVLLRIRLLRHDLCTVYILHTTRRWFCHLSWYNHPSALLVISQPCISNSTCQASDRGHNGHRDSRESRGEAAPIETYLWCFAAYASSSICCRGASYGSHTCVLQWHRRYRTGTFFNSNTTSCDNSQVNPVHMIQA